MNLIVECGADSLIPELAAAHPDDLARWVLSQPLTAKQTMTNNSNTNSSGNLNPLKASTDGSGSLQRSPLARAVREVYAAAHASGAESALASSLFSGIVSWLQAAHFPHEGALQKPAREETATGDVAMSDAADSPGASSMPDAADLMERLGWAEQHCLVLPGNASLWVRAALAAVPAHALAAAASVSSLAPVFDRLAVLASLVLPAAGHEELARVAVLSTRAVALARAAGPAGAAGGSLRRLEEVCARATELAGGRARADSSLPGLGFWLAEARAWRGAAGASGPAGPPESDAKLALQWPVTQWLCILGRCRGIETAVRILRELLSLRDPPPSVGALAAWFVDTHGADLPQRVVYELLSPLTVSRVPAEVFRNLAGLTGYASAADAADARGRGHEGGSAMEIDSEAGEVRDDETWVVAEVDEDEELRELWRQAVTARWPSLLASARAGIPEALLLYRASLGSFSVRRHLLACARGLVAEFIAALDVPWARDPAGVQALSEATVAMAAAHEPVRAFLCSALVDAIYSPAAASGRFVPAGVVPSLPADALAPPAFLPSSLALSASLAPADEWRASVAANIGHLGRLVTRLVAVEGVGACIKQALLRSIISEVAVQPRPSLYAVPRRPDREQDLIIHRAFSHNPALWAVLSALARGCPKEFADCLTVSRSLLAHVIAEWHADTASAAAHSGSKEEVTLTIIGCLGDARMVPGPLRHVAALIGDATRPEVARALIVLWDFVVDHPPKPEEYTRGEAGGWRRSVQLVRPVDGYTARLRDIVEEGIDRLGRHYALFATNPRPRDAPSVLHVVI